MTEAAFFSSSAQKDCFNELDVERFRNVATLDLLTSEICQEMDGAVFDMSEYEIGVTAPPFHPWCRTFTVPHFDDNKGNRIARDPKTGKTYDVPNDMSYKEWCQKHVVDKYGQEQADIMRKMAKNETQDFNQYQRYKKVLGKDVPAKSFAEFQELKYNKVDEWRDTKGLYRYLSANPESNKEYYSVNKEIKKLISEGKVPETIGTAVKPIPVEFLNTQKHALKSMEQRNVTEADARSYINNASVMFKQNNGLKNMYYSHAGAAAVAVEEKLLVTVFPSSYYDKGAEGIMEVLKNHGK